MAKKPLNLKKARVLVTNDDGIHAPGLKVLVKLAKTLSDDVWVVAPETEQSATSRSVRWKVAEKHLPSIVRRLAAMQWSKDLLVNVNFPAAAPDDVTGIVICRQGRRDQGTTVTEGADPSGRRFVWIGGYQVDDSSETDTDLAVTAKGGISVTPLHLDLTHRDTMKRMKGVFD